MPKIKLKPNSPEYADSAAKPKLGACDMPGCAHQGEYRAPKDRSLSEHYWFCQDHVRDYNRAWNFFEGMAESEVQDHIFSSLYGDRPTWKYGVSGDPYAELYQKAWQTYASDEEPAPHNSRFKPQISTPESEALALMNLEPPITLKDIKSRYKELAKKHHPDLNKGCPKSEELLKQINMAYTILKLAYEKFEDLPT